MNELATFGAGCFWGVEEAFRQYQGKGIIDVEVGYAGGHKPYPSYSEVCANTTGHAEVVRIKFDREQISYDKLLMIFWDCHDPTTLNRQGNDVGFQYRSIIFYHSEEQKIKAMASKEKLNQDRYAGRITTQIIPATDFYRAEEYHQQYIKKKLSSD